jgi:hypothetical protein
MRSVSAAGVASLYHQRPRPNQPPPKTTTSTMMMIKSVVVSMLGSCGYTNESNMDYPFA